MASKPAWQSIFLQAERKGRAKQMKRKGIILYVQTDRETRDYEFHHAAQSKQNRVTGPRWRPQTGEREGSRNRREGQKDMHVVRHTTIACSPSTVLTSAHFSLSPDTKKRSVKKNIYIFKARGKHWGGSHWATASHVTWQTGKKEIGILTFVFALYYQTHNPHKIPCWKQEQAKEQNKGKINSARISC